MALSDKKLFAMAVQSEELKAEGNTLLDKSKKVRDRIVPEMLRRGTKTVESKDAAVRVTLVQPEGVETDTAGLLKYLETKKPKLVESATSITLTVPLDDVIAWIRDRSPALANRFVKRFTTRHLDLSKVARLVQDGDLSAKTVAKYSKIVPGTPYVRITLRDE